MEAVQLKPQQTEESPIIKKVVNSKSNQAYFDKKIEKAQDPLAIVFPARLKETGVFADMMYPFDYFINLLRLQSGTYINLQDVMPVLEDIDELLKTFTKIVEQIGAAPVSKRENPEIKKAVALSRPSYVIIPRTVEGIELALLIKRFEGGMVDLKLRADVNEWKQHDNLFSEVLNLMRKLEEINMRMSELLRSDYKQSRKLALLEASLNGEETQVQ